MTPKPLAMILVLVASAAAAQGDDSQTVRESEARERARIRQTRAEQQALFARQEAQCYQLFAVSDCLIGVRRQRREVLADLRRQDLSINDAQRKRLGAAQLLRSDERLARP